MRTLEISGGYVGGRVNKLQSAHSKQYRRSNNRLGKRFEFSPERLGSDGRDSASQRALVHLCTLVYLGYLDLRRLIRIDSKPMDNLVPSYQRFRQRSHEIVSDSMMGRSVVFAALSEMGIRTG